MAHLTRARWTEILIPEIRELGAPNFDFEINTGVLVLKPPPLKVEIWEFSFRGLNCAKKSRNSASGVLIVPKEILIKSWYFIPNYPNFFRARFARRRPGS